MCVCVLVGAADDVDLIARTQCIAVTPVQQVGHRERAGNPHVHSDELDEEASRTGQREIPAQYE